MPQFQISYWPHNIAGWAPFGPPVEAPTPEEAIEKRAPQAIGRYRVTLIGADQPGTLFRVDVTVEGCCRIERVDAF